MDEREDRLRPCTARHGWWIEHRRGTAQALHDAEPGTGRRRLVVNEVVAPAVVLGSTQQVEGIEEHADALGWQVARRRSGGGVVALVPGAHLWVDVIVPAGDVRWDGDVERATWWVGEAWARVLEARVPGAEVVVHRRGVSDRTLGRVACFAALGPGEVTVDGHKVLGISQRRTRELARIQCLVNLRWEPEPLLSVLAPAHLPLTDALAEALGRVMPLPPAPGPVGAGRLVASVEDGWDVVEELAAELH